MIVLFEKTVAWQTWKKAPTRRHFLLRFVEISGFWKIDYSYFGIKLMNCENFFLTIKYLAYESLNLDICENVEKSICGNFNY